METENNKLIQEEEIQDLLQSIKDAEFDITDYKAQLKALGYKGELDEEEYRKGLSTSQGWVPVKERPLITKDEAGRWIATEDGDKEFIAAVPYHETGKGEKWWIRHCVIEDQTGLCVVGDDWNDVAGWSIEDVTHWRPLPLPPRPESEQI